MTKEQELNNLRQAVSVLQTQIKNVEREIEGPSKDDWSNSGCYDEDEWESSQVC